MCGCSIDDYLRDRYPALYNSKILTNLSYFQAKATHYIWERTQKKPKKTCCKSCGSNYTSWLRTQDPKRSYIKESFECDCCGKPTRGGRLIMRGNGSFKRNCFKLCRACHRKKITTDMRRIWEILNREKRSLYQKVWRKKNPVLAKLYKKHYLERVKNNQPRLGQTRKISCAATPTIVF